MLSNRYVVKLGKRRKGHKLLPKTEVAASEKDETKWVNICFGKARNSVMPFVFDKPNLSIHTSRPQSGARTFRLQTVRITDKVLNKSNIQNESCLIVILISFFINLHFCF